MQGENIHVSGRGFASYRIPAWIFLPRLLGAALSGAAICLAGLWIGGWDWVASGFTNKVAAAAGLLSVAAVVVCYAILRSQFLSGLWNLRKDGSKKVYGGDAGATGI